MFVRFLSRFGDKEVLNNAKLVSWSRSRCVQWGWGHAGTCPCCPLSCQGHVPMWVPHCPGVPALPPVPQQSRGDGQHRARGFAREEEQR